MQHSLFIFGLIVPVNFIGECLRGVLNVWVVQQCLDAFQNLQSKVLVSGDAKPSELQIGGQRRRRSRMNLSHGDAWFPSPKLIVIYDGQTHTARIIDVGMEEALKRGINCSQSLPSIYTLSCARYLRA